MADVLVDLDDGTTHKLLHRAERAGRSLNDEVLLILADAIAEDRLNEALNRARRQRAVKSPPTAPA